MIRRILVPTDGSEYSRRALMMAIEIGKPFNAEITLLHVFATPEALGYAITNPAAEVQNQLTISGEEILKSTYDGIDFEGLSIIIKNAPGHPASVIIDEITNGQIDMVIMGCHGYGPFRGSLMGSVSQKVLFKSEKPVLLIK